MIIEFKVANYRSINEEQTLSFVADRATRHPDNLIKRPGYRLLKAVGLFGANASGKSNLIKALGVMRDFVRDSATKMNDGDLIVAAEPFRLDSRSRKSPSRFEITFLTDGTLYTYGFAADQRRVHEEWLIAKAERLETQLFHIRRSYVDEQYDYIWAALKLPESLTSLLVERTRENALFLSTGARENVKELLPVFRFLFQKCLALDMSGMGQMVIRHAVQRCTEDEYLLQQVGSLLRDADTGIEDVGKKLISADDVFSFQPGTPPLLQEYFKALRQSNEVTHYPGIATYRRDNDGNIIEFNIEEDDSLGTNKFFSLAVPLLDTLRGGAFIAIDEIDASMHPLLTRRLLEMFQSEETNPNGAQLLFTTHDPSLLDQELFRRDQIWLAEKCKGASTFFSLADIQPPIRSTESFLRNYLAGRYGGTPYLGRAFSLVTTPVNK